jgi:hypothetical protein
LQYAPVSFENAVHRAHLFVVVHFKGIVMGVPAKVGAEFLSARPGSVRSIQDNVSSYSLVLRFYEYVYRPNKITL